MSSKTNRDNALWAKHVEGSSEVVARVLGVPQNAPIVLLIEGTPIRFVKMWDGIDGRPTPGLRPADSEAKRLWDALRERRGERVRVALPAELPHGAALWVLLSEWDSPEDAAAYARL